MEIADERQLREFLTLFPELEKDEVMFVSLSSRAKYLTDVQRLQGYRINRNEMFHRRWFWGSKDELYDQVISYIESVKVDVFGELFSTSYLKDYECSSGHLIPLNTVSVYVNINPSSMRKAAAQLSSSAIERMMTQDYGWFLKLQSKLNTEVQKAKSRRVLLDIDFDVPEFDSVERVMEQIGGYPIKTHSGYHLLIEKKNLEKDVNLGKIVNEAQEKFDNKEIIINSNAMIPLLGTFQGGFPVQFVK